MQRVIKNTILNYIYFNFKKEDIINPLRIFDFNKKNIKTGYVIYLCEREFRVNDNFALKFALNKSDELKMPLKIIYQKKKYENLYKTKFINIQIEQIKKCFQKVNLDFVELENVQEFLINNKVALLIIDFNPILDRSWLFNVSYKIFEIDGHNIVPARYISDRQEYSAATFRPKIYYNINSFLTEVESLIDYKLEAEYVLEEFIKNKLDYYNERRNDFTKKYLSNLSKYLNLGFISSQRVALEVIKSKASNENKEAFLEELIIRKELADNFCLYAKNFRTLRSIPIWAKKSLQLHEEDLREYNYSLHELEQFRTHDDLWNATQSQLIKEGSINSYLRMYWAKKILEWSKNAEIAIERAIYLNDKYAFDAPSPNGYVGILWAIGGLHDRAFKDWKITGKIRRMTYNSIKRKNNINEYIDLYL